MNTIVMYTIQDMNALCAILSRNGYVATAYSIVSTTENTCCGKQWRIDNKAKEEAKDIINELLMNGYDESTREKAFNFLYPDKEE